MYKELRDVTIKYLASKSVPIPQGLPLLESDFTIRDTRQIIGRLLCLFVVVVNSYKNQRDKCSSWLAASGYETFLSEEEKLFLYEGIGNRQKFMNREEALYAISFILGLSPTLEFNTRVPKNVVEKFPNISEIGSELAFLSQCKLQNGVELISNLDLYFCLDWFCVNSVLQYGHCKISPYITKERRRAFEWTLNDELNWDQINLDT